MLFVDWEIVKRGSTARQVAADGVDAGRLSYSPNAQLRGRSEHVVRHRGVSAQEPMLLGQRGLVRAVGGEKRKRCPQVVGVDRHIHNF